MAGNGDFNNPLAFTSGASSLTTGAHGTPPAQGDVIGDGGDPDRFLGSFTLQVVAPTLGVAALPAVTGNGDLGDVFGAPDRAGDAQVAGLVAFNTGTSTLVPTGTTTPAGHGDLGDTGGPTTTQGEPNDSNAGFSTLTSFNSGAPSLGLGTVAHAGPSGDIDDVQGRDSGPIFQVVWTTVAPALVAQTTTTPTGQGDIPNPYSWQDSVFYLTSRPYPVVVVETMRPGAGGTGGDFYIGLVTTTESMHVGAAFTGGAFFASLVTYTFWPEESLKAFGAITGGEYHLGLVTYTFWPEESLKVFGAITGGDFHTGLVIYTNWPEESLKAFGAITGGVFT